jgi:mono/diheme cytochrome c family protein
MRALRVGFAVAVIAWTWSLSTGALSAGAPQSAGQGPKLSDGLFNAAQAQRGETLYGQVCSACHLADLTGSDQAPSLAGGDFLDRWDGQTLGDLVDRVRTSMPADNVGSLNTQSATDIVSYLLKANKFPAGADELKADRPLLKTIIIKKP